MDIFLFDIEIRIENVSFTSSASSEIIFDLDKSIQTSEEDYLVFSPFSEKRSSNNNNIICSEDERKICAESMNSVRKLNSDISFRSQKITFELKLYFTILD